MRIINLTGHVVEIRPAEGGTIRLPASDRPLRLLERPERTGTVDLGGCVVDRFEVSVELPPDLPDPQDDLLYVVPQIVARSLPGREDLVYPYDLIRNEEGRVTGARALARAVAR